MKRGEQHRQPEQRDDGHHEHEPRPRSAADQTLTPSYERADHRWPDLLDLGKIACAGCTRERLRAIWPGHQSERPVFRQPEDLLGVVSPLLAGRDREHGLVLALDTRYRLIDVEVVSIGTADHTFMAPREVYRDALLRGATAIALAHNHPSGDPTPSAEDVGITERLARAGITLGVELIDHLVIGSEGEWRSLAQEGLV